MTLTEQNVRDVLAEAVSTVDAQAVAADQPFAKVGIDSLDHATLLLALQEKYGLEVADEDVDRCNSIAAIVAYAASK